MSALCYVKGADPRFGGYGPGVHLTNNGRETLCGLTVLDIPEVPRGVEPLSCIACHETNQETKDARDGQGDVVVVQELIA